MFVRCDRKVSSQLPRVAQREHFIKRKRRRGKMSFHPVPPLLVWKAGVTMATWQYTGQSWGGWHCARLGEGSYQSLWHQHWHTHTPSHDSNCDIFLFPREQKILWCRCPVDGCGFIKHIHNDSLRWPLFSVMDSLYRLTLNTLKNYYTKSKHKPRTCKDWC